MSLISRFFKWCCSSLPAKKARDEASQKLTEKLDDVNRQLLIHKGLEASSRVHIKVAQLGIRELTESVEHTIRETENERARILRLSDSGIDFVHDRRGRGDDEAHRKK